MSLPTPTIHMICGFLGAGKSTFSKQLAKEQKALRLSLDELYIQLFTNGPTYELDADAMSKLSRVVDGLWTEAVLAGTSVVLDFGLWSRESRERVRAQATPLDADVKLYWLRCSDETGLERCLKRNGSQSSFLISPEGYSTMRSRFQPPTAEENAIIVDTDEQHRSPKPRG